MKNRLIIIAIAFFSVVFANAATEKTYTTDYLTLTPSTTKTLDPGSSEEKFYVTVSLTGETIYAWYQMDIILPDGVDPILDSSTGYPKVLLRTVANGMYPATQTITGYDDDDEPIYSTTYTSHTIEARYITLDDGRKSIRVGCSNQTMAELAKTTGDLFRFYVKASTYAKPQENAIYLDGVALITKDAVGYVPSQECKGVTVTSNAASTMSISSSTHWSTCILPFDVALPDGVKAYSCAAKDDENSVLKLTPVASIAAYIPYILYSEDGFSGSLTGTVDASKYPVAGYVTDGFLNGAITAQQITEGYVLQNLSEGVKFYNCNGDTFNIPAGKCWVVMPSSSSKSWSFSIEDEQTGINGIKNVNTESRSTVFTLGGQHVNSASQKGVYIMNGKKILVK